MNWILQARKLMEGMLNPNIIYDMPFVRMYCMFFLEGINESANEIEVTSPEDARRIVNEKRAARGLPPLPPRKKK